MKQAKLVIVKGTKKECENYFKMISATEDVEMYDVDYAYISNPKDKNCICRKPKLGEVKW